MPEHPPSPASTPHHAASLQALTDLASPACVLVVDDEPSIRDLIRVMLEMEGYQVLSASDGEEALQVLRRQPVDLVSLDVMMPKLDGWEVADAMDADPALVGIPRLMVSGKPLTELRSARGSNRAGALLTKPFDFAEFTAIVARLLAQRPHSARRTRASVA